LFTSRFESFAACLLVAAISACSRGQVLPRVDGGGPDAGADHPTASDAGDASTPGTGGSGARDAAAAGGTGLSGAGGSLSGSGGADAGVGGDGTVMGSGGVSPGSGGVSPGSGGVSPGSGGNGGLAAGSGGRGGTVMGSGGVGSGGSIGGGTGGHADAGVDMSCGGSQHLCGGACVANDVNACGSACTTCPAITGGTPTCDGTKCGGTCTGANQHVCGTACVSDTSAMTCGTSCTACPAPTNYVATCKAGMCGTMCASGFKMCSATCIPSSQCCSVADADCVPRALAPWSNAYASSNRPTFRWALPGGTDGAHLEICKSRDCATPVTSADVTGTSYTVTTALPSGVLWWRLRARSGATMGTAVSPAWPFISLQSSVALKTSFGVISDFDDDGYSDLVISDDAGNDGGAGAFYTYHGGAAGIVATVRATAKGAANSSFGFSVASVGDVNGDGFTDIVVGAAGAGYAAQYLGSSTGIQAGLARQLSVSGVSRFGDMVAGAGDLNGDGYADVVVSAAGGAYVFYGSSGGLPTTPSIALTAPSGVSGFGTAVAGAGDVNGDGYADLVVTAPPANAAYIYFGGAAGVTNTPSQTISVTLTGITFGPGLAGAGDVNGDGYGDVAVGSYMTQAVYVFLGGASGLAATPQVKLTGAGSSFGFGVAGAGDMNGDGRTELVITDFDATSGAMGWIFPGSAAGTSASGVGVVPSPLADGWAAAGGGDYNNDGFSDAVITAPSSSAVTWTVHGAATLPTTPQTPITNATATGRFGISVSN